MRCLLAILFASIFAFSAQAQYLNISPQGLTAGSTPISGCTSLNMFYNNAGTLGCIAGSSWNVGTSRLNITGSLEVSMNLYALDFWGAGANSRLILRNGATVISSPGSGVFRLGGVDVAAPEAQELGAQNVAAGTINTAGVNFTLTGSRGTGTGSGGNIFFQTAPAGSTGSAQNALVTALTIDGTTGTPIIPSKTVAGLPTCNAGATGALAYVTDQLTACPALDGTFTGGGAVKCLASCNGTAWVH